MFLLISWCSTLMGMCLEWGLCACLLRLTLLTGALFAFRTKMHLGWSDHQWADLNTGVIAPTQLWRHSETESLKQHSGVVIDACDCIFNVPWKQVPPRLHAKAMGVNFNFVQHAYSMTSCLFVANSMDAVLKSIHGGGGRETEFLVSSSVAEHKYVFFCSAVVAVSHRQNQIWARKQCSQF